MNRDQHRWEATITQQGRWSHEIRLHRATEIDWISMEQVKRWNVFGATHADRKAVRILARYNRRLAQWTVTEEPKP